ncbi:MAG: hypothetical protein RLY47_8 [Candidatus Parcubacteria bacterium]|jgi:FAD/FMN-containing dehydrogenase
MSFVDDLRKLDAGDVLDDDASKKRAARDTSLFEVMPSVVVAPRNADDVKKLVRYVSSNEGMSLTGRSGGTGMDGGALTSSIVVDFGAHMNRIGAFTETRGTAQPGTFYRDFEKESLKRDLLMPSYPASREICAVGGMVANNAGGELTLRYGKTADYVRELSVVLSDGNEYQLRKLSRAELREKLLVVGFEGDIYRKMYELVTKNKAVIEKHRPHVTKNSSGYALWDVYDERAETFDLTRLFTGSQGTLGMTTSITFGLVHPAKHSKMLVAFLDDLSQLPTLVKTVLIAKPTTFESYDDKTLSLALRFFSGFIKRMGIRKLFTLLTHSIPELMSILSHGLPKLIIQITFDGDDEKELNDRAVRLMGELKAYNPRYIEAIGTTAEVDDYWLIRRESFNLLRTKVKGKSTAPFIDDIVVPVETLSDVLPKLNAILDEYKEHIIHNIAGHIGNGNFHIIPLMDLSNKASRKVIPEIMHRVYNLVIDYGGSISGEHNDGMIRTPFVRQQFGDDMYKLFEETKSIFDPKNIFNPNKKVGGTLHNVLVHMKRS